MMRLPCILLVAALTFAPAALARNDDGDIVWPTYSRVVYPTDMSLNCAQVRAEIEHVKRDLAMLEHAKDRVEQALHSTNDLNQSMYSNRLGGMNHVGIGGGGQSYAQARGEITTSRRVAQDRLNHLNTLTLICTP